MSNKICSRASLLGLLLAVAMVLLQTPAVVVSAADANPHECEGNACSSITLTWNDERQQFKVENSSGQEVKVTVQNFAGPSSVVVLPHKENYLELKTFDSPYVAAYQ
jgi:hypothetical protein